MTQSQADAIAHARLVQGASIDTIVRLSKADRDHIEQVLDAEAEYERRNS